MVRSEEHLGEMRARLRQAEGLVGDVRRRLESKAIEGGMRARSMLEELEGRRRDLEQRTRAASAAGGESLRRLGADVDRLWTDVREALAAIGTEVTGGSETDTGHGERELAKRR